MSSVLGPQKLGVVAVCTAIAVGAFGSGRPSAGAAPPSAGREDFGALAPAFVRNTGVVDRAARFVSVGGGRPVFFTENDVRIVDVPHRRSLWLTFVDGRAQAIEGESPTGGQVTFLRSRKTSGGLNNRIAYRDVVYRQLWAGIDARVTGAGSGLKYSFEIAPYGDPQAIRFRYEGADRVAIASGGELAIETGDSTIVDEAPTASQRIDGRTVAVDVRFVRHGDDIGFAIGAYNRA